MHICFARARITGQTTLCQLTQIVLSIPIAQTRGSLKVSQPVRANLRDIQTTSEYYAKVALGPSVALARCLLQPRPCPNGIARDAASIEQGLGKSGLRLCVAHIGCLVIQLRSFGFVPHHTGTYPVLVSLGEDFLRGRFSVRAGRVRRPLSASNDGMSNQPYGFARYAGSGTADLENK